MTQRFIVYLTLMAVLALFGVAHASSQKSTKIRKRVEWSGNVTLKAPVVVEKSGTLVILPGTRIRSAMGTLPKDTPWIYVEGELLALGEPGSMIEFSSSAPGPLRETEDMISVLGAKAVVFENVSFFGGGWAIHLHETANARITGCLFKGNYGGVRFKSDGIVVKGNVFEGNRIGVRALHSLRPVFKENRFKGNLTGIFFREGIKDPVVRGNVFDDEEYDIKLGEIQEDDVDARENSWILKVGQDVEDRIYDELDSPGIGRVVN